MDQFNSVMRIPPSSLTFRHGSTINRGEFSQNTLNLNMVNL